ncbi:hypothetical protein CANCADRAFT_82610 [Tortispora caseinolytica NRRL Y-17796]|uniref:Uncharacterized protein n=1 Tax=Tortispora caseinolytica NRRL Y-17796 TaxID=767744 RepID=A0A1E4TK89_9ASCO|nr:hypothetical protein CANCADRAFT_82610 [Tortispora caseinolytica NRRL Y-17796]
MTTLLTFFALLAQLFSLVSALAVPIGHDIAELALRKRQYSNDTSNAVLPVLRSSAETLAIPSLTSGVEVDANAAAVQTSIAVNVEISVGVFITEYINIFVPKLVNTKAVQPSQTPVTTVVTATCSGVTTTTTVTVYATVECTKAAAAATTTTPPFATAKHATTPTAAAVAATAVAEYEVEATTTIYMTSTVVVAANQPAGTAAAGIAAAAAPAASAAASHGTITEYVYVIPTAVTTCDVTKDGSVGQEVSTLYMKIDAAVAATIEGYTWLVNVESPAATIFQGTSTTTAVVAPSVYAAIIASESAAAQALVNASVTANATYALVNSTSVNATLSAANSTLPLNVSSITATSLSTSYVSTSLSA